VSASTHSITEAADPPPIEGAFDGHPPVAPWATSGAKRAIDLLLAGVLSVLTIPLVAALCTGSAIVFRSNPFFTQHRIGEGGRSLWFVKVRSLPVTVPSEIDKYQLTDRRIGRWGSFLRRTHLDELPQLWLVVAGQMSLVGPRPELPTIAATFDPGFVHRRTLVKPGITGLWQVSEGVTGLIGEHPEYDELYVERASLRLDLWVLARTVRAPGGSGIVSLGDCLGAVERWGA